MGCAKTPFLWHYVNIMTAKTQPYFWSLLDAEGDESWSPSLPTVSNNITIHTSFDYCTLPLLTFAQLVSNAKLIGKNIIKVSVLRVRLRFFLLKK